MIHTIRTVAVGDQESKIDSPIILYRGDREVEVEFTINGSKFTFTNGGNVIKSTNATHGQLVINTPTGENMFSEVTECHDGKVVFVITKEMIDELIEVGFYSFQIRLFDESQVSRVTIPPVLKGIDIRNPIAAEDETNVVDIGLVDYAVVVKDEFEDLSTFLPDGNYNKTEWESKDVISGAKLNKIEDALYSINSNMEAADLALFNKVENINKNVYSEIEKLGNELESEVEEFERNLNINVEQFKIDTNMAMAAHKNEVSEELEVVNSQLEHNMKNINELGQIVNKDYGDGITDASEYIQNLINNSSGGVVYIPYPSKFYLLKSKITTKWTNFGTRIEMQGSPRMGASAFQIDNSFTDDCVFEISHDAVMLKNVGISNSGSKKVIGIKINNGAKWVRLYNCGITGFHMGVSYATYYASFTDCLFYNNDYGIYVGNPNGSCGSLSIYGGHLRNNGVNELENGSAVYLQKGTGTCNGIAFYGTTFETNRRHVKNDGGSILLDCCYLGDGCATECIENIRGTTTIDGKFVQACGGAGSHHFIETTDITVFGCGVKVSGGNVNLNNLSLSQNIHCSNGIINGSAASGTDIMLIDGTVSTNNVTSDDHCQATILKNSGNKMQLVKSYIKGGDLSDKNKIYTTFPVITEGKENGYGGNILTLSNDGSITAALIVRFDFEIPEYYVNKTMYCVMVLGKQSGAYNPRLSPVTDSFITNTSAPFIGNTSLVGGNFSCVGVNNSTTYDNCVRIFYLPIKPLVTTGKIEYRFSYPTSTGNKSMELYGCFLVDEKYKGILAKYHE